MATKKTKVAAKGASPAKRAVKRKVAPPVIPALVEVGPNCSKCGYFLPYPNTPEGACRRFPAVPLMTMQGAMTMFPAMHESGWCGEFRDKTVPARNPMTQATVEEYSKNSKYPEPGY